MIEGWVHLWLKATITLVVEHIVEVVITYKQNRIRDSILVLKDINKVPGLILLADVKAVKVIPNEYHLVGGFFCNDVFP